MHVHKNTFSHPYFNIQIKVNTKMNSPYMEVTSLLAKLIAKILEK